MNCTSTRSNISASTSEAILRGLAPDGGLFVPDSLKPRKSCPALPTLKEAEDYVLAELFDDIPQDVRDRAVARMLSRFPENEPVPLVKAGNLNILELFHGPTGAFKDVALSMLPVFMAHAAQGRKVLVLTATSGDTGSASMAGFADCDGASVAVFFPNVGTSRIQRLQMTTPAASNVRAFAIRGNFDDAQSAVKRIFADKSFNAEAARSGVTLSSANSINVGRLVPQIAYYLMTATRLGCEFDVCVPSGNFGNILAAWCAKTLGAPIKNFICASNANRVLERFISTGVYDPRPELIVTNSPSMDIRKSSNVERLLWLLNDCDGAAVTSLFKQLDEKGFYTLQESAYAKLKDSFVAGFATPEETEAEMLKVYTETGYLPDPHTAVAINAARKAGFPSSRPLVIASTATPYKFTETCEKAVGKNALSPECNPFKNLETAPITQKSVIDVDEIDNAVRSCF